MSDEGQSAGPSAGQSAGEATARKNRGWFLQWGIGILLTAVAVFFLTRVISWEELKAAFVAVPPTTLLLCLAIYLFSMGLRALAWQTLLQRRVSLGRRAAYRSNRAAYPFGLVGFHAASALSGTSSPPLPHAGLRIDGVMSRWNSFA
mgnify:CR=1 FL=1